LRTIKGSGICLFGQRCIGTNYSTRDLEKAVEDLSELLEQPIDTETIGALRQKVTDKAVSSTSKLAATLSIAKPWQSHRSTCRRETR
jgi:hypothetical protein